jgi:hypothetical protein
MEFKPVNVNSITDPAIKSQVSACDNQEPQLNLAADFYYYND